MKSFLMLLVLGALSACGGDKFAASATPPEQHETADEAASGPHGGRLLIDGAFAVELAIVENGADAAFHAWASEAGTPLAPSEVALTVELQRLGGRVDTVRFQPETDYLRGTAAVAEPHSFVVTVLATRSGVEHRWTYEHFEGRVRIPAEVAAASGLKTEAAGPATLTEAVTLYGQIATNAEHQREVAARFPGLIRSVRASIGETVKAGQTLAVIESNQSLEPVALAAPMAGVITARDANPGEQSGDKMLFTITDPASVWAELSVFPRDRARVKPGAAVVIRAADGGESVSGTISAIGLKAGTNQAVTARVVIDNQNGRFPPGTFVTASVAIGSRSVPLAVKASGLQTFRDKPVVFEQVGDEYEVRMLDLGQQQGEWVEVLGGLEAGANYVVVNSYLIKADIEKSGASHDH